MSHPPRLWLEELARQARALDEAVTAYLVAYPSARIAHHQTSLLAALSRELVEFDAHEQREADREARRAEHARDRSRRDFEPHELRVAAKMGFDDPAEWRRYIDEREAAQPSAFPTPEEWRARG